MSTVTLSKPHCAITSAEKPEGIASQAFTTALPEAHTFLTLLVATLFLLLNSTRRHCERSEAIHLSANHTKERNDATQLAMTENHDVARWMLTSLTPTSRAVLT